MMGPPEHFANVRSPPDLFLASLLNIIQPKEGPPEKKKALFNAPLKSDWRFQLDKPARLTIRVHWFLFLIVILFVKSEVKKQIGRR